MLFLLVAFDLSRLMAWTYFAFFVVAVFWLFEGRAEPDVRPARIWPWTTVSIALAMLFWSSPTIYSCADLGYLVPCERFCFKERTPQGGALDRFRRSMIASPTFEYTAPGGLLQGATGHNERGPDNHWHRIARAGRDKPGNLVDLDIRLDAQGEGVTVRAPAQTNNAIIGSGTHRLSISYGVAGVETANAETRFTIYNSTLRGAKEIFRAPLKPEAIEFVAIVTTPAGVVGERVPMGGSLQRQGRVRPAPGVLRQAGFGRLTTMILVAGSSLHYDPQARFDADTGAVYVRRRLDAQRRAPNEGTIGEPAAEPVREPHR